LDSTIDPLDVTSLLSPLTLDEETTNTQQDPFLGISIQLKIKVLSLIVCENFLIVCAIFYYDFSSISHPSLFGIEKYLCCEMRISCENF
jgi:hypothetical protein